MEFDIKQRTITAKGETTSFDRINLKE